MHLKQLQLGNLLALLLFYICNDNNTQSPVHSELTILCYDVKNTSNVYDSSKNLHNKITKMSAFF